MTFIYRKVFPRRVGLFSNGTAVGWLASTLAVLGQEVAVICEGQEDSLRESGSGYAIRYACKNLRWNAFARSVLPHYQQVARPEARRKGPQDRSHGNKD
ncbi:MAG: hypothetical protein ACREV9_10970 [Burkholderiales bacterium]